MKMFLHHEELARDSRFVRQDNAQSTALASMPDDVDTVVNVFDQFSDMIEESVRGTAAEPLFEAYGPGFALTILNEPIDPDAPEGLTRLLLRMHGIFVGEMQALEGAARSLWDFPDSPWEFKMNMARQCWDEARHVQIFEKLLTHLGGYVGMFPESTFLFEAACSDDPAMRVAGVNRGLEGLACDVCFGSEWVREFTKGDPEYLKRTQEYRRTVDKQFSFGGARSDREDAAIPIAWEDRLEAGFTQEELEELAELSGSGPSKETLKEAARILRERHFAKRAAQKAGDKTSKGGEARS
ncbi:MAG: DUF455 family protein [Deltaproteobacteria bacterium]|nr:DUF455 family protein [Deltaproteobacteria bacterium]